jgi:hypothetical protein
MHKMGTMFFVLVPLINVFLMVYVKFLDTSLTDTIEPKKIVYILHIQRKVHVNYTILNMHTYAARLKWMRT